MELMDSTGRKIDYLRISLIDRCNLRCSYCMPPQGVDLFGHDKVMTYEELAVVVKGVSELGISSIRLTGGEPLIRKGLIPFVKLISSMEGINDISLTTNGVMLEEMAKSLKNAGVNRLNISLDTLKREKYKKITGKDCLDLVLKGIDKSIELGFEPIKINTVLLKDENVDEILDFVHMTLQKPIHIRFIEMMPLGKSTDNWKHSYIPWTYPLEVIKEKYEVEGVHGPTGKGPAKYFKLPNSKGTFGVISAVSEHFCANCNRLRLTSDGKLKTCLFGKGEVDLRKVIQTGTVQDVKRAIVEAVKNKPLGHDINSDTTTHRSMWQIGG
ncbi:GTP 3',8-cyclase MoaA [Alkalicella caledoniensis]|uniref:GTP 3',8-cyclase n=1 Tax=Alkalicella caledoniensis TaxID=2731377 RepID=A0A7G9W8V3_ALKCA|nr:GTP 3',8-cyclase MoaA [Alkalicella caledoniensis]QNO15115.1 GTP 3',8-cyclase MoaA [Alkalicella caledoniensis]